MNLLPFFSYFCINLNKMQHDTKVNNNSLNFNVLEEDELLPFIIRKFHGISRNKAKNIMATCMTLCEKYGGEVPEDYDELLKLPGVGRKTANVVTSIAFHRPAIAVDTHVFRVANRLKLAVGETPLEVEKGLQKAIPKEDWSAAHHWLIWHGRKICKARRPLCDECPLREVCPSAGKAE